MGVMKKWSVLLPMLAVAFSCGFGAQAIETNMTQTVARPLAEVRKAIDAYCESVRPNATNHSAAYFGQEKADGEVYKVTFFNCHSPSAFMPIAARRLSDESTAVEVRYFGSEARGLDSQKPFAANILQGILRSLENKH